MELLHQWNTALNGNETIFTIDKNGNLRCDLPFYFPQRKLSDKSIYGWALIKINEQFFFHEFCFSHERPNILGIFITNTEDIKQQIAALEYSLKNEMPKFDSDRLALPKRSEKAALEFVLNNFFQK